MAQQQNNEWSGMIVIGAPVLAVLGAVAFGLWVAVFVAIMAALLAAVAFTVYSAARLWIEERNRFYVALGLTVIAALVGASTVNIGDEPDGKTILLALIICAPFLYFGIERKMNQVPPAPAPSGGRMDDFIKPSGGAAHDPAFDFDPSQFSQEDAPASSSRDVATVGTADDETDERLWRMAMDERTPEAERKAAMRAIQKRGKPFKGRTQ